MRLTRSWWLHEAFPLSICLTHTKQHVEYLTAVINNSCISKKLLNRIVVVKCLIYMNSPGTLCYAPHCKQELAVEMGNIYQVLNGIPRSSMADIANTDTERIFLAWHYCLVLSFHFLIVSSTGADQNAPECNWIDLQPIRATKHVT